jgi:hypothetical protein
MNTWIRKVGMGAAALTLAGVLGGCNDGDGGGGGLIRLFFGINGQGNCTQVIVDVNLDTSFSTIARDEFGEPQCDINQALEDSGCDIDLQEFSNGGLRAIISGCTIPAISNLFSCLFEDVDISELTETASSQCSCTSENCDENPPVCISLDPEPDSCEDCDNDIDDDDDGLEDCEDPDCRNAPECSPTSTTSTSSTTVTDTSTTTSSTSTTNPTTTTIPTVDEFNCILRFTLDDDVTIGSLQWDTDYSNAPGFLLGLGGQVECTELVDDTLAAFNDCDTNACPEFATKEEVLDSGIISLDGFTGPRVVSECTFRASVTPVPSDFTITVIEASQPDLTPIVPLPDISVAVVECEGTGDTTTTLGPVTTTEEPVTTTTAGETGGPFTITFNLTSATANVGALQWSTDYSGAPGSITGKGSVSSCTNEVDDTLFAENDKDLVCTNDNDDVCTLDADCEGGTCTVALKELTLGIVSIDGFAAPAPLVICQFDADSGQTPTPEDFVVTIEDSTDPEGTAITAVIGVTVTPGAP